MKNYNFKSTSFIIKSNNVLQASKSYDLLQKKPDLLKYPFIKKSAKSGSDKLNEEIKICQWRLKTQFPIVRVKTLNIVSEPPQDPLLEISIQGMNIRLAQVQGLPLFKIMYLIKQSIIGFERLFHRFGSFLPTSNMVALNHQHRCKVWLNEDFSNNQFLSVKLSQTHFLTSLFRMFEQHANKLKNTNKFFTELTKCSSFCQSLSFIEWYAKTNRIIIPECCRIQQRQRMIQSNDLPNKKSNVVVSKPPLFIKNASLRLSLNAMIGKKPMCFPIGESFKSKQTGDTDLEPNRLSKSNYQEKNFTNSSVSESKPECKFIFKNQIPLKFSPFNSFNFQKPNQPKPSPENPKIHFQQKPNIKIEEDFKSFGNINDEDDEEANKLKEQEVYSKNNWEKSFKFLIDDTAINSSVHLGGDVKKTEKSNRKLDRLDKIKTDVTKSVINTPGKQSLLDQEQPPATGVD